MFDTFNRVYYIDFVKSILHSEINLFRIMVIFFVLKSDMPNIHIATSNSIGLVLACNSTLHPFT